MADRQPSLLTNSQREYLQEGKEGSAGRMARKRLKERVHEGLHDFSLLLDHLDERARKEIFVTWENDERGIQNAVSSIIGFLYLGTTDNAEPADLAKDIFEERVEDGIKKAYLQRGESVRHVSVDITVETGPLLEDLREREDLGLIDILQLVEAGELSGEEARGLMNELLRERGDEIVDEEERFQGGAARFHIDDFDRIFEDVSMENVTDEFADEDADG